MDGCPLIAEDAARDRRAALGEPTQGARGACRPARPVAPDTGEDPAGHRLEHLPAQQARSDPRFRRPRVRRLGRQGRLASATSRPSATRSFGHIIADEGLDPDATRAFVERAFRNGADPDKTGAAVTGILPPTSRSRQMTARNHAEHHDDEPDERSGRADNTSWPESLLRAVDRPERQDAIRALPNAEGRGGGSEEGVSLLSAGLIVAAVMAVTITAMLLVRQRAPEGSYFEDGDRAAGVFGVLATGFAVLLGLVVFLAFESFDTSRSGAEAEAQIGSGSSSRRPSSSPAGCVSSFQASSAATRDGGPQSSRRCSRAPSETPATRGTSRCSASCRTVEPLGLRADGVRKWLDQRSDREEARADRTHGAEGVIPLPLWIVLFLAPRHLRLHAVLRRQRRAQDRAGDDGGRRRGRHRLDVAPVAVPRPPLPVRTGWPPTRGHGANNPPFSTRRRPSGQ